MSEFFSVAGTSEVLDAFGWVSPLGTERLPLSELLGRILAEDISASADIPHFTRASMDGYALRASDTFGSSEGQPAYLDVTGRVEMGEAAEKGPGPGEAFGISTGGMMPPGTDGVLMWEYARESEGLLEVFRPVAPGEHVIRAGEDVAAGEKILTAGRRLRPADIGLLSGLGHPAVDVSLMPRIALISTGDELVESAAEPGPGQVRNINQHSLGAWVRYCGAEPIHLGIIADRFADLEEALQKGLEVADMVLISGGSSAGIRDMTRRAVEGLGAPGLLYHGLAVKPGKPTVVGAEGRKPVFGLPGHPVSAMVVFLILVRPVIQRMLGMTPGSDLVKVPARLADNLPSQPGREDFYQVRIVSGDSGREAVPVFRKSGLASAMVRGEGMVRIPKESEGYEAGEEVDVEIFS